MSNDTNDVQIIDLVAVLKKSLLASRPATIPASVFSWNRNRTGVAEISDLGREVEAQIARDRRFVFLMATGESRTFVETRAVTREGEIVSWHYSALSPTTRIAWQPFAFSIVLFND